MANGNDSNWVWYKVATAAIIIAGTLIGVVFAIETDRIEQNARDIDTLNCKAESTSKAVVRVEEGVIYIKADLKEIKDMLKRLEETIDECDCH